MPRRHESPSMSVMYIIIMCVHSVIFSGSPPTRNYYVLDTIVVIPVYYYSRYVSFFSLSPRVFSLLFLSREFRMIIIIITVRRMPIACIDSRFDEIGPRYQAGIATFNFFFFH